MKLYCANLWFTELASTPCPEHQILTLQQDNDMTYAKVTPELPVETTLALIFAKLFHS